jgi:hypothetical protein
MPEKTKSYTNMIIECAYCGERYGKAAKYCAKCQTQPGRKLIFDANVKIALENKALGHTVPAGFRNWK